MAHTKGKWVLQGTSIFAFNKSGHNRFACQVRSGCRCGCEEPALIEELEANARLIASAPELLGACKMALEKEKVMPNNWKSKDLILSLEQAIAKAEGKE
jgi:hypothetical protein